MRNPDSVEISASFSSDAARVFSIWMRSRRWKVVLAQSILAIGLMFGHAAFAADDDDDDDDNMSMAEKADSRFPQAVLVGSLLHRTVLEPLESQPTLGHVEKVVRASDNSIKVVVNYGGFLGFGTKPIAVPVEAMVLLGQYMEIVDLTPAELDAFPRFADADTKAVPASETIQVGLARPSH